MTRNEYTRIVNCGNCEWRITVRGTDCNTNEWQEKLEAIEGLLREITAKAAEGQVRSETRLTDRRMPVGSPRRSAAIVNAENMEAVGVNPSLREYVTPVEVEGV